jgi:hypothetical protein
MALSKRNLSEKNWRKMALLKRRTGFPQPKPQPTTHKSLALCEGLGYPFPLIFARAICATHALCPSARSIGFCVIWVCISSSSSSWQCYSVCWRMRYALKKSGEGKGG